jgi:hypothetical protein
MEVLMSTRRVAIAGILVAVFATYSHSVGAQERSKTKAPRVGFDCGKCDGGTTPNAQYKLVARHSGKCLDVWGSSREDVPLKQYSCHGGSNQRFRVLKTGDNYYKIVAQHSGRCVDVSGASSEDLAPVIQHPCHGGDNQAFRLVENGDQGYEIVAKHSSKCLDVLHESGDDGAAIVQFACHGGQNQTWVLKR